MNSRRQALLICLGLMLLTVAVFWRITGYDFVPYDDNIYVLDNPHVRDGLSLDGIIWAFTEGTYGYWHPVTLIVFMAICELFGPNAGAHHAICLLTHTANVLLLFGLLTRMTGATGRSAFVAALFAIHPLHVESVAWIGELKDVMSTTFWLLAATAFVIYTQRERRATYWLAAAAYAVGLMVKPMIVTLPVILLLLDFWPLGRMFPADGKTGIPLRRLILEKVPLFTLAALSSFITYLTQSRAGAVGSFDIYPLPERLTNVLVSYAAYVWKMFWPDRMANFYPFQHVIEPWRVTLAALFLAGVSIFVVRHWRQYRFLATGWLWYLVTLLPVIGFIQCQGHSMADRYTYIPLAGIFIMMSWGAPALADHFSTHPGQRQRTSRVIFVLAGLAIAALSVRAWFQVGTWKDALTLAQHAVRVTSGNYWQYNNLGIILTEQGRYDEAISNYFESIKRNPDFAWGHNRLGLGNALMLQGRLDAAVREFRKALRLEPGYAEAHNNLGIALAKQGKFEEAISHFLEALKADAGNVGRQKNLLRAIDTLQDKEKAASCYRTALEIAESANERELADVIREKLPNP